MSEFEVLNNQIKVVVGRFAPSPTGALHEGSLLTAVASYLQAKSANGAWILRMEDLDKPREIPGAATQILFDLERLGFEWDGSIDYQSDFYDAYSEALRKLECAGHVFPCVCSRKKVQESGVLGVDGYIYNGHCRSATVEWGREIAWRLKVDDICVEFDDGIQGHQNQNLARDVGDFVLKRMDGIWAYQLAVVVDDARQGINQIVRGADLLDSTPRQIYLQRLLGIEQPEYFHLPVVSNEDGEKLSKQTKAPSLYMDRETLQIYNALLQLNQKPPVELREASLPEIWSWALQNWDVLLVPQKKKIPMLKYKA